MIIEVELEDWRYCKGCPYISFAPIPIAAKCKLDYRVEIEISDDPDDPVKVGRPKECIEKHGR